MSTRPSRRATRRTVVESSDEDTADATKAEDSDEDDFAPAPAASPRRSTAGRRNTSTETPTTPKKRGRPKKSINPAAALEPSQVFDPDQTAGPADRESDVAKKPSPRKRKSVAPRASQAATPDLPPPLPTPPSSKSHDVSEIHDSTLSDMTTTSIHEKRRPGDDTLLAAGRPVKALDAILERPMDIVLKSRTMALPAVEDLGPKPRIVITYLVLTNFKSYAGRQEVGPFHASFSSVVGPNGSGKSNVIDSLLFVFGFRASKMRQGKISALIHNSAEFPNLDHCEVSVHFQEVMDVVSPPGLGEGMVANMRSLVVRPRSFPTRISSSPERRSRTIRAPTTSTARRPTLPPSRPCCATGASISTTSAS
jgi:structural maintenance of chromosome 4